MAVPVINNLDLNKNELQNAVIQPLSTAPANPRLGQIYFNTTDKNIYRYDGTQWVTYQTESEVFWATYGTTTYADVLAAYNAGKLLLCKNSYTIVPLTKYQSDTFYFYYFAMGTGGRFSVSSSGWSSGTLSYVNTERKINNKNLSSDITLDSTDIGAIAAPSTTPVSGDILIYDGTSWTAGIPNPRPIESVSSSTYTINNTYNHKMVEVVSNSSPAFYIQRSSFLVNDEFWILNSSTSIVTIAGTNTHVYINGDNGDEAIQLSEQYQIAYFKLISTDSSNEYWVATIDSAITNFLPSQSGNSGKYLTTNGANASWANVPEEVFVATYNSTSFSDIATAYNAGKTIICKNSSGNYCLLYRADNSRFDFALPSTTGFSWYYVDSTHWWTAGSTFVPSTRTVNSKALSSNITLDASDVGALPDSTVIPSPADATPLMDGTAAVGTSTDYAREDHVHPTDTSRQATITASGILKGNGSGTVSAAVAGTDYQTPITTEEVTEITVDTTVTASSNNLITSGAVATAISNIDALPSQSGNTGKFLTTNGTAASWAAVPDASSMLNRSTAVNVADANYSTIMARGIYAGDTDLIEGTSSLTSGVIYLYYE